MKLGILLNGLIAIALTIPIIRYLFSAVTRERKNGYLSWISLGSKHNSQKARRGRQPFGIPM
jgi:hypothetical protein